jgi:Outer membrane protein beta-barrel domain
MKKILTTLAVLLGIYSAPFAQTKNTTEFGGGIGFNAAGVAYSGSGQNTAYTSGFNAGLSAEYYFSNRWSLKGKLIYDQKGWGDGYLSFSDGTYINGINFHLNYLTIPVMANWHFGRTRNWYLNFGPYMGILLNTSESSNSGIDIKSAFNTNDFGLAAGIGVKFPVANHVKLFVEADGQSGFTNIFKVSDGSTVHNTRSSFNAGFLFPLR